MADFCSLCGTKLSFFGGKALVCANQDEMCCSACYDKLYPMENLERGKYLLEHGRPENPEKMQEFITVWEERARLKKALEPPTRTCPGCGGEMACKLKNFRIGADGGGGLDSLFAEQYNVDLYACPECGKVELYTANFAAIKRKQELKEQEVVCSCGTRHSSLVECPTCAHHRRVNTPPFAPSRPKNEKKPPWEK